MKGERPLAEDELRGSLHIFFQWIPPKLAPLFCILQQVHAYPSSIQKTRHVLQSHLTPHHPFLTSIFKLETFLFQRYHFLPSHPYFVLLHQLHSHLYHPNSYLFNHLRRIYHDFLFFPRRLDLVPYFWRYSTIAIFSQGQRQRVSFWKFFYCFSLQSPGREKRQAEIEVLIIFQV